MPDSKQKLNEALITASALRERWAILRDSGLIPADLKDLSDIHSDLREALSLAPLYHDYYTDFLGDVKELLEANHLEVHGALGQEILASVIRHLSNHEWYETWVDPPLQNKILAHRVRVMSAKTVGRPPHLEKIEGRKNPDVVNRDESFKAA